MSNIYCSLLIKFQFQEPKDNLVVQDNINSETIETANDKEYCEISEQCLDIIPESYEDYVYSDTINKVQKYSPICKQAEDIRLESCEEYVKSDKFTKVEANECLPIKYCIIIYLFHIDTQPESVLEYCDISKQILYEIPESFEDYDAAETVNEVGANEWFTSESL